MEAVYTLLNVERAVRGGVGVDVRHSLLAQIGCREPRLREARAAWMAYGDTGRHRHRRPAAQVRGRVTKSTKPGLQQAFSTIKGHFGEPRALTCHPRCTRFRSVLRAVLTMTNVTSEAQ